MSNEPMCLDCGIRPEANIGGICHQCLSETQDDPSREAILDKLPDGVELEGEITGFETLDS